MKSNSIRLVVVALMAFSFFPSGCSQSLSQPPSITPVSVTGPPHATMPSDSLDPVYNGLQSAPAVFNVYKTRGYEMLWLQPQNEWLRNSMIQFIKEIEYYGLRARWYHVQEIDRLTILHDPQYLQRLDALLTDAFLSMSHDVKLGRTASPLEMDTTSVEKLLSIKSVEVYFNSLEPGYIAYRKLKATLGSVLDSLRVADPLFDPENMPLTSNPVALQIQLLQINMERWRLQRECLADKYIFINVPSYVLKVVENDSVVFESKIIVGAPDWPTPELSSLVDCIVTFPYWYVPRKIAVKEYLPVLRKDSTFLRRNQFDVLNRKGLILKTDSIPWESYSEDYFPVTLRQREGPENSLGLIKFVFDNPFAIFLHDTNAKRLFRRTNRALSHGCIRVEKADELAHYLVTGSLNKTSSLLEKYLEVKERRFLSVPKPMPIYIRYFTCEAVNDKVIFLDDIYEKDQLLINVFNHTIERL